MATETTTTRRAVFGLAALPVAGAALPVLAADNPDAELFTLVARR